MSVISGTRRGMKELVDGTLRVSIDIDPIHRADFFALFSRIDMPVALAPLVPDFEQQNRIRNSENTESKDATSPVNIGKNGGSAKGGELARWAGILSNDPVFWEWAGVEDEDQAAEYIRNCCVIESRAELDHDRQAGNIFRNMMARFSEWKDGGKAA